MLDNHNVYAVMLDIADDVTNVRTLRKVAEAPVLDETLRTRAQAKVAAAEQQLMARLAPYAKAFGIGTAGAAPLLAGGALLEHKAAKDMEKLKRDALIGAAGLGTGLIALNQASKHVLPVGQQKMAADNKEVAVKLATYIYLDNVLAKVPDTFDKYDARALRAENAKEAADLLLGII